MNPLLLAIGSMVLLGMLHVLAVSLRSAKEAHGVHHEVARLKVRYYAMGVAIERDDNPDAIPEDMEGILLYLFGERNSDESDPIGRIKPDDETMSQAA